MNTLEKIQALQAGEFDKVLEGTPYGDKTTTHHERVDIEARSIVYYELVAGEQAVMQARTANAAKVEVTNGVLDEVIDGLEGADSCQTKLIEAITLLKTLRETL